MSPAAAAAAAASALQATSALQAKASREGDLELEYERELLDSDHELAGAGAPVPAPAYDDQPPPPPPPALNGMQDEPSPKRARHSPSPNGLQMALGNGLVPPPAPAPDGSPNGSPGDHSAGGGGVGKVDSPGFMNGGHAAAAGMSGGMSEGPPRGTLEGKEGAGRVIRRHGAGRLSVPSKGQGNGASQSHGAVRSTASEIWQAQK